MGIWGFIVLAVIVAVFLLFLRDIIASGVTRGILAAHEILESEKLTGQTGQPKR